MLFQIKEISSAHIIVTYSIKVFFNVQRLYGICAVETNNAIVDFKK